MSERTEHVVWELLDAVQMDLRAATAKMVELRSHVAALKLTPPVAYDCPHCGPLGFRSQTRLAEHLHVSHDGPLPEAWAKAEALAGDAMKDEVGEAA